MRCSSAFLAALAVTVQAAKDSRTFAVLRFYGDGPLLEDMVDPIVSPGQASAHMHTLMGGSNIGISATGETMMESNCSNALIVGDNSGYWVPKLFFHDKAASTFEPVDMFYMNVYYFFEPTDDEIKAFPIGLQMVAGDASLRSCPDFGGELQLDGSKPVQPIMFTCPRSDYNVPAWPSASESDGTRAGIADPNAKGQGQGFPFAECDGYASPLRQDVHMPSCYDPSKDLTDYKNNMVYPTVNMATGKQNCPKGFVHVPHLFYEMYWNTPVFKDRWTPGQGYQPFVLANGDLTGCSSHADFLAAWEPKTLQHIIDTCNAGDEGMDKCGGVTVRDRSGSCDAAAQPAQAKIASTSMKALPGNNPLAGWGVGSSANVPSSGSNSGSGSGSSGSDNSAPKPASSSPSSSAPIAVATDNTENEDVADKNKNTNPEKENSPAPPPPAAQVTPPPQVASPPADDGDDGDDAAILPAPVSSSVVTLPNGQVSTIWETLWVTVTQTVYERSKETDAPYKRDVGHAHGHAHAHEHMLRHRSPHARRVRR